MSPETVSEPAEGEGGARRRRLGVLGSLVWDTIHSRDLRREPVEEWGGIGYALSALSVSLPPGWEVLPIVKVGRDLAEEAFRFVRGIPRTRAEEGLEVVREPNNRVELSYEDQARRTERMSGGVPPWEWEELRPLLPSCDALYVNFISGMELELPAARRLAEEYPGPTYADLHSLFLGIGRGGVRVPRTLPAWREWLRCFDAVQMNEGEFELLAREWGDPWELAAEVVGPRLKLVVVTLGSRGSAYIAAPGFDPDPETWPGIRNRVALQGPVRSGRIPPEEGPVSGDPTGSGDVWGSTLFSRMLGGDSLEDAMRSANRMGARNVKHRGARGLRDHLQGRLAVEDRIR